MRTLLQDHYSSLKAVRKARSSKNSASTQRHHPTELYSSRRLPSRLIFPTSRPGLNSKSAKMLPVLAMMMSPLHRYRVKRMPKAARLAPQNGPKTTRKARQVALPITRNAYLISQIIQERARMQKYGGVRKCKKEDRIPHRHRQRKVTGARTATTR